LRYGGYLSINAREWLNIYDKIRLPMHQIRRATLNDVTEITACIRNAYTPYIQRIGKKPAPMLEDYAETVTQKNIWILEDHGSELLGVLILVPEPEYLLIENIAVKARYQGQGFGGKLMDFAESEALKLGYKVMRLYTNVLMVENKVIYEHLGWKIIGLVSEEGYDRVYMEKQILVSVS
jgi:GNAT superfamily N-acetyltransferase